jgi:hypothetical protein
MKKSRLLGAVCACFAVVAFNANAALVNENWNGGVNNITRDDVTGLRWLDLTETRGMSRDAIIPMLQAGELYEGFRYATNEEVVALWNNFGIDLSLSATFADGLDPNVVDAAGWLGNVLCSYLCDAYPYGVLGTTGTIHPTSSTPQYGRMGAWHYTSSDGVTEYTNYNPAGFGFDFTYSPSAARGHYLIAPVPIPATAWLFGSGLLGLVGMARRKKA